MTHFYQDPALWGLIAGTPLAITALVRARKTNKRLRAEADELAERNAGLEARHAEVAEEARARADESTRNTLKTAMRTLQGLAGEQQLAIAKLQHTYGSHQILEDLLSIDHMNSQFSRRAQSIAVLCDGWLGRRRDPALLYDVVRSAKGRIKHFTRVEIRSQSTFAVVSRVVEPIALALAELLDNATSYSAPDTVIEINIRPVPKGVCVIIDDAGVGMNEEEKERATRLLTATRSPGVAGLGNPPQFGFTVVGVLAARYGFTVSVDSSSPYGGVRAVVLLPEELLTSAPEPEEAPAVTPSPVVPPAEEPEELPAPVGTTPGGLPKRRRKGAISIVPVEEPAEPAPARDIRKLASVMGAFQAGTRSGRRSNEASSEEQERQ